MQAHDNPSRLDARRAWPASPAPVSNVEAHSSPSARRAACSARGPAAAVTPARGFHSKVSTGWPNCTPRVATPAPRRRRAGSGAWPFATRHSRWSPMTRAMTLSGPNAASTGRSRSTPKSKRRSSIAARSASPRPGRPRLAAAHPPRLPGRQARLHALPGEDSGATVLPGRSEAAFAHHPSVG